MKSLSNKFSLFLISTGKHTIEKDRVEYKSLFNLAFVLKDFKWTVKSVIVLPLFINRQYAIAIINAFYSSIALYLEFIEGFIVKPDKDVKFKLASATTS